MFTRTSALFAIAAAAVLSFAPSAHAQNGLLNSRSTLHITLPEDSPVTVVSADWGESTATARGGAMLLDLHTSLSLRNSSNKHIRGVTLLVLAQEVTPGGKGSVSVPSLNIGPGENFPLRLDLTLLRPLQTGSGPLVEIHLDGVLFDDMSFYGPNKLNSRRAMRIWELEAVRDRKHFKRVLASGGRDALRQAMLSSLDRQADRQQMGARVTNAGRATVLRAEREVQLAFLDTPRSPVRADGGSVRVAENEVRLPQLSLQNETDRSIRSIELGWLLKDRFGREFVAGGNPVAVSIGPRQRHSLVQDVRLRFNQPNGQPLAIQEVNAFLSSVEYEDGRLWIPSRSSRTFTPSPEEQRLTELYRKRGIEAVVAELEKL